MGKIQKWKHDVCDGGHKRRNNQLRSEERGVCAGRPRLEAGFDRCRGYKSLSGTNDFLTYGANDGLINEQIGACHGKTYLLQSRENFQHLFHRIIRLFPLGAPSCTRPEVLSKIFIRFHANLSKMSSITRRSQGKNTYVCHRNVGFPTD